MISFYLSPPSIAITTTPPRPVLQRAHEPEPADAGHVGHERPQHREDGHRVHRTPREEGRVHHTLQPAARRHQVRYNMGFIGGSL